MADIMREADRSGAMAAASLAFPAAGTVLVGEGVVLGVAAPASRWSLRGRDAAVLAQATGLRLPERIGDVAGGVAKLGPDEWYARLPEGHMLPMVAGLPVSVVDISARAVGLRVEGPEAITLLSQGCPLDLARMAVGRATRTLYETVEIIVWRESETRWHIEVWRSFAAWLWAALANIPMVGGDGLEPPTLSV